MKPAYFPVLIGALTVLCGCQTYRGSYRPQNSNYAQQPKYIPQKKDTQALQAKAMRKEFDGLYEQVGMLTRKVNELQDTHAQFNQKINSLQQQLAGSTQQNQQLTSELSVLKQLQADQDKNVRGMINNVVDQVAKDTATAIGSLQQQQAAQAQQSQGQFYEYKVQPGATLGAIAKAYKCSIKDIKISNNLKSDVIYVGQKLKIPRR